MGLKNSCTNNMMKSTTALVAFLSAAVAQDAKESVKVAGLSATTLLPWLASWPNGVRAPR